MRSALFILWICSCEAAEAQNDSLNFVNAHWKTVEISSGIVWKEFHFDSTLFQSNQNINLVQIKKNKRLFQIGYEKKELKLTSSFGNESNALIALNGTFFDTKNGGSVDYIRSKGEMINETMPNKSGARAVHQKAAIVIKKGRLGLSKFDGNPDWEKTLVGEDVMVSGPLLTYGNKNEIIDSSSFSLTRHPRSVIAITKNHILLLTIDGRHSMAHGMSLFELQKICRWLGAHASLNLDGGGSTTLWINHPKANGVVNYPSDNKKWDHEGERKVANAVLVKMKSNKSKSTNK